LFDVGLDVFGCALFGVAADFANHDDGVRVGILVEELDRVEESGADDGIAADADAGGLADPETGELVDGFVGEGATAPANSAMAWLVNAARHDAHFAFAGGNDTRAVGGV